MITAVFRHDKTSERGSYETPKEFFKDFHARKGAAVVRYSTDEEMLETDELAGEHAERVVAGMQLVGGMRELFVGKVATPMNGNGWTVLYVKQPLQAQQVDPRQQRR